MGGALTICITTRNRPDAVLRALRSLALVAPVLHEVIITDDASTGFAASLTQDVNWPFRLTVVANETPAGLVANRHAMTLRAETEYVMHLDDDARIFDATAVYSALHSISADPRVGAIAFGQRAHEDVQGELRLQPSHARFDAVVPTFIGYAHMLRRSSYLKVGGYREWFFYQCEEKELCKRLFAAGYLVVYKPASQVVHEHDARRPNGADWLRYQIRNSCLDAVLNEPMPVAIFSVPLRLIGYGRALKAYSMKDPGGWVWLLRQLVGLAPTALAARAPLPYRKLIAWRRLRHAPLRYTGV